MKKLAIFFSALLLCGFGGGGSAPDPFAMSVGNGEPDGVTINSPAGYSNTNGYTVQSSVPAAPSTTAVLIYAGQSLIESAVSGTYSTLHAGSVNFNIYDSGTYPCKQPILGTPWAGPAWTANLSPSGNNIICQIADDLITAGTYTEVIMVPVAIGGTTCANWNTGGAINKRIAVTVGQLAKQGLTPATGFTGDFYIMWHQGESELPATPAATIAACLQSVAGLFSSAGTGTSRFFIPQSESWVSGATQANVISGQSLALSGCSTCRAGANWDSLNNANRQDMTHFNQTGAAAAALLDKAIIVSCHALGASC